VKTDLVLSPFNAAVPDLLDVARAADIGGFDSVWVYDHFSATMVSKQWSHHPFTLLGAIAAVTERIHLGCLVANVYNRHPVQTASALSTLSSLAPGRVWCGLGAGAGNGTRFGVEHPLIGSVPEPVASRRLLLRETIECIGAIWRGERFEGIRINVAESAGITMPGPPPPIVVGASTTATALIAAEHADGVNLQAWHQELVEGDDVFRLVREVRAAAGERLFDVAVNCDMDLRHPLGGDVETLIANHVNRRTLAIRAPFDIHNVVEIGSRLSEAGL